MRIESVARAQEQTFDAQQRKLWGVHYTPDSLVDFIVRRTIQPYLRRNTQTPRDVHIVDPACGSGLFLLRAFDTLLEHQRSSSGHIRAVDIRRILERCLYGVDIDPRAVAMARDHLHQKALEFGVRAKDVLERNIVCGDALLYPPRNTLMPSKVGDVEFDWRDAFSDVFRDGGFDCVVGNPPYIRIQHVQSPDRRLHYAQQYACARGRFDVATLFIELAYDIVRPGGRVGYVVTNKVLMTKSAEMLRKYLLANFRLIDIVDLADTKMFAAAVLPMVLIMERRGGHSNLHEPKPVGVIIRESLPAAGVVRVDNLLRPLENKQFPRTPMNVSWSGRTFSIARFEIPPQMLLQPTWTLRPPGERAVAEKLRLGAVGTLGALARKVSVGLKTTADDVFINPMTRQFIVEHQFERRLLHPVLGSRNVQRWSCGWREDRDHFVLYPHQIRNGRVRPVDLKRFPNVGRYLSSHREQLEARAYVREAGRQWYEIWVHQSPNDFGAMKIVTPDIAAGNRFALDDRGFFVNGTCFYIILHEQNRSLYLALLAVLNSEAIEFFHKTMNGNTLYSGRYRYWSSYLQRYPIPNITTGSSVVKEMTEHAEALMDTKLSQDEILRYEQRINELTYQLFRVQDRDIAFIKKFIREQSAYAA